jgi:hypothetical protein
MVSTPETLPQTYWALERWDAGTLTSEAWNRKFLPGHFSCEPAPFHNWLSNTLETFRQKRGSKLALIAPCESAKTTWITFAGILRDALEGLEPYQLIISETQPKAEQFLQTIRDEPDDNELIQAVYGEQFNRLKSQRTSATHVKKTFERDDHVRFLNGCQIQAIGRGFETVETPTLVQSSRLLKWLQFGHGFRRGETQQVAIAQARGGHASIRPRLSPWRDSGADSGIEVAI